MKTKVCKECNQEKPETAEYFHRDRQRFHAKCKVCRNSASPVITGKGEKVCSNCNETKPATLEFFHKSKREKDGLRTKCKVCRNQEKKEYGKENREKCKAYTKKWDNENREYKNRRNREYSKRPEVRARAKQRWVEDESYRVYHLLMTGLNSMLKDKTKTCRTLEYVGCSKHELVEHLNKTKPDTHQLLHIDHIIQKNLYNLTEQELKKCWNYRNLRWITAEENLKKGDTLNMDLVRTYKIQDLLP